MNDGTRKLLCDILEAGRAIQDFVQPMTLAEYLADLRTRSAVERQFEILGEAFVRLREKDAETFAQFPQAPRIISFRNRLIHGYNAIDQEAVWDVVQRHLPALLAGIERILPPPPIP
jgi:uncharacterized protein with HEPN domain